MDLSQFAPIVKAFFDALVRFLGLLEVMFCSRGRFPPPGDYSAKIWCYYLNVDIDTFRDYVKKHGVPYRKPGKEIFISVDDFRRHVKYVETELKE